MQIIDKKQVDDKLIVWCDDRQIVSLPFGTFTMIDGDDEWRDATQDEIDLITYGERS